jgi:uncharacterized protein with NRDE domain
MASTQCYLVVFDGQSLYGLQSQSGQVQHFAPGLGAVSNAGFGTPLAQAAEATVRPGRFDAATLFGLLAHDHDAPEHLLPDTGLPPERERLLSRALIRSAEFTERSFDAQGPTGQVQIRV